MRYVLLPFLLLFGVVAIAQPTTSPPDAPVRDSANVLSIYSDSYENLMGINYDPNWGQSGHTLVDPNFALSTGDTVLAYPNFNYQGTGFEATPQDLSSMQFLHVDIWVPAGTDRLVKVTPIDNSGDGPAEVLVDIPLTAGEWNILDLSKSDFTGMSWSSVIQIKFDGQFNSDGSANTDPFDIYLDNIYFWKNSASATPTDAPANPTVDSEQVVSVYGDQYAAIDGINYDPNWGQSGHMLVNPNYEVPTGDTILAYPNFNYQGTGFEGNPQNLANMEFLHVDIWVPSGTDRLVKVSPIDNSGDGPGEVLVDVPLNPGAWNSVDLPKSDFTDMSWNSVIQIKFDGQFNGDGSANTDPFDIYLDNIYFWTTQTGQDDDATLSDLQLDGTTVDGFASNILNYDVTLPAGTMDAPEVTATATDTNATLAITQASAIPGTSSVVVTAADGMTTLTYNVNFSLEVSGPQVGAPDPTEMEENVISMFSDSYMDVDIDTWNTSWSNATFEDDTIAGNPTKKYTMLGFNGVEMLGSPIDASEMDYFHMDVWSPNMESVLIKLVDFLGDGFQGANGDTEAELTFAVPSEEWLSLKIPLSDFTDAGMTALSDLNQLIISSVPFGTGTLYVDNVYFSKDPSSTQYNIGQEIRFYPNPVQQGHDIFVRSNTTEIQLYSYNGLLVRKANTNQISTQGLQAGMYMIRIKDQEGNISTKPVVIQ